MNDTTSSHLPVGKRFSHVYMDRPTDLRDGVRLRRRVAALFDSELRPRDLTDQKLALFMERETGEKVLAGPLQEWRRFFEDGPLDTFLDSITLLATYLATSRYVRQAWIEGCARILREEQTAYSLDEAGGLHLHVDKAFQADRALAVEALRGPRYAPAADLLSNAYAQLDGARPRPRDAFKNAFDAAETLFKLMSGQPRLGGAECRQAIGPLLASRYAGDTTAQTASSLLLRGFCEWVAASHQYRHGPGEEGGAEPPPEIWQLLISQAAGHIRWLAELDRWKQLGVFG